MLGDTQTNLGSPWRARGAPGGGRRQHADADQGGQRARHDGAPRARGLHPAIRSGPHLLGERTSRRRAPWERMTDALANRPATRPSRSGTGSACTRARRPSWCRPGTQLDAEVTVSKAGESVNGQSIMGIMMLAAEQGSRIDVKRAGPRPRRPSRPSGDWSTPASTRPSEVVLRAADRDQVASARSIRYLKEV